MIFLIFVLTGANPLDHILDAFFWCPKALVLSFIKNLLRFGCFLLMIKGSSLKFEKNLSCLKMSRTLLKIDDTLLEFRRTWRFLTGAGSLITLWMCSFDVNKLKFQIWKRSDMFELSYEEIHWIKTSSALLRISLKI